MNKTQENNKLLILGASYNISFSVNFLSPSTKFPNINLLFKLNSFGGENVVKGNYNNAARDDKEMDSSICTKDSRVGKKMKRK